MIKRIFGILTECIRQKIESRRRYLEWPEYVNDILAKDIEIFIKTDEGRLEVWN